jgi:hypothetical protein
MTRLHPPSSPSSPLRRRFAATTLLAGALLLGGCATWPGAYGGYPGGYPGGVAGYPDPYGGGQYGQYGSQMLGTVQRLDRGYNRIVLVVEDGYGRRGQQVAVQYDHRTRLFYQGRQHPVEGLERGDVIRIDAAGTGNRLYARTIEVVRNVREGGYYGGGYGHDPYAPGGGYGMQELRGRIAYVDPRSQTIRLDGGYGGRGEIVRYDARTLVEWQGRRYQPRDLDPGDIVRIQARRVGSQWWAERIRVEVNSRR